jgi:hypothetical protein
MSVVSSRRAVTGGPTHVLPLGRRAVTQPSQLEAPPARAEGRTNDRALAKTTEMEVQIVRVLQGGALDRGAKSAPAEGCLQVEKETPVSWWEEVFLS